MRWRSRRGMRRLRRASRALCGKIRMLDERAAAGIVVSVCCSSSSFWNWKERMRHRLVFKPEQRCDGGGGGLSCSPPFSLGTGDMRWQLMQQPLRWDVCVQPCSRTVCRGGADPHQVMRGSCTPSCWFSPRPRGIPNFAGRRTELSLLPSVSPTVKC